MANEQTFRVWLEQQHVLIPQLLFQHYKAIDMTDEEALIIMHLLAFQTEGNNFPTPQELMHRSTLTTNAISTILQRLMQKGLLEIAQMTDANGIIYETFSVYPLWERLTERVQLDAHEVVKQQESNEEGMLFSMFETEFGRLFSPIEIETISKWLDEDGHSVALIKQALKEAVLAGKMSLKYIDRILYEWQKKNIQTPQQAQAQTSQFREKTQAPMHASSSASNFNDDVPFYNWLEERE
ncbi:MAG TPA: DnaD domain-containing protein [Metalysinibacillus jejuensis]|uniref:DnaD domain-containing protein n=1 Tax=Metalysinibacillus jejuensis TaxID=914327 RepID=A0A921N9Z4_9BACL|nr:DnaD domain-containing protein [Metalysinibacillus jejuensis]HJH10647.1 DnaD domain-containing protein [Metalysinibacillus jejuensis]